MSVCTDPECFYREGGIPENIIENLCTKCYEKTEVKGKCLECGENANIETPKGDKLCNSCFEHFYGY